MSDPTDRFRGTPDDFRIASTADKADATPPDSETLTLALLALRKRFEGDPEGCQQAVARLAEEVGAKKGADDGEG